MVVVLGLVETSNDVVTCTREKRVLDNFFEDVLVIAKAQVILH